MPSLKSRTETPPSAPSRRRVWPVRLVAAGLAALLAAAVFSWPLAGHCVRGMAYTPFGRGKGEPLAAVPGDHLQLLYHFWLAQDTFAGHTPLFHNLYEFNTGDDAERYEVSPYYLPFSAFYAVGAAMGGRAFGWNFAGWMSLWLTAMAAWALARRYVRSEAAAGLLALIPVSFPYTWVNLLSGSPTGQALMWVPILLYGLDRWAADASPAGAAWAGAAVFFSEWTDTHVFFFGVLASPFWVAFAWRHRNGWRLPRRDEWLRLLAAAWPLLVFGGLAAFKAWGISRGLHGTTTASGRTGHEVSLFSVPISRLWETGGQAKTYVGWPALAVAAALAAIALAGLFRRDVRRAAVSLLLLLLGLAGIAVLASGTANPFGPRFWTALVRVVPPYRMIRQADKVFCLVPTLSMLAVALGVAALPPPATARGRRWRRAAALVAALAVAVSWQLRHRAGVCLPEAEQGAYAAVAADAAARGEDARAVALPLWPGDSHFSSLYQHDASLYRIRMLNGYRPTVRQKYREEIFDPLESVNLGWPSPGQLRILAGCRVGYILFHEDAFPEKAGSFPAGAVLRNLLRHPRLRFLARDGGVWAFRILGGDEQPGADDSAPDAAPLQVLFPVRTWNWKNSVPGSPASIPADAASSDRVLRLDASMADAVTSRWIRIAGPWDWTWRTRARGGASLEWVSRAADGSAATSVVEVASADWQWLSIPLPPDVGTGGEEGFGAFADREVTADIRLLSGEADVDAVLLTCASGFPPSRPGESATLPASAFFRPGFELPETGAVRLLRERIPDGDALHSRNLWLEPGLHRVELLYAAPEAAPGTLLGRLSMGVGAGPSAVGAECEVRAGAPAAIELDVPANRFFRLSFDYSRQADCDLLGVRFTRPE